jgi:hypothetical protein
MEDNARDFLEIPDSDLPLPVVTGAIGLFLAYVLPGGLSGGEGFLVGLGIGFGILTLAAHQAKVAQVPHRCPECGHTFQTSSQHRTSAQGGYDRPQGKLRDE